MPLILAIEPDKRQAAHITTMARHRLHAELVLADSAERGLVALGGRVPDLILTPALLPPQDETALADGLRRLDERAAHVQTLTIPLLALPRRSSPARGMLSALRRERPESSGEGCDPAVFAEQITAYLERAAIERQTHQRVREDEPRVREDDPVVIERAAPPVHEEPATPDPLLSFASETFASDPLASETVAPAAVDPLLSFASETFVSDVPVVEAAAVVDDELLSVVQSSAETLPSLEETFPIVGESLPEMDVVAMADAPEFEIVASPAESAEWDKDAPAHEKNGDNDEEDDGFDEIDLAPFLAERPSRTPAGRRARQVAERPARNTDPADAAAAIMAAVAAAERVTNGARTASSAQSDVEVWTPRRFAAQPVWPALEGVEVEGTVPTGPASASALVPAQTTAAPEPTPIKKKRARNNPLQDEWGFFDPAQCGFAALLEKLEEITDKDDIKSA
jgi:hypothetical protein